MKRPGDFAGRTALVTGAASGIGLAVSQAFALAGACVWLIDRDGDRVAEARRKLPHHDGHQAVTLDVTEESGWTTLAARIDTLDILVNNAGHGVYRLVADTSLAQWHYDLAVNLDGAFLGTKAMLPLLAATRQGAIVNVSSIRGIVGGAGFASYCAAKGALRLFTKAVALECAALGNGVRANSLHPGFIETPLTVQAFPTEGAVARRRAQIPMGRAGTATEVADAILFLASNRSRYMTGAELVIDGGSIAG